MNKKEISEIRRLLTKDHCRVDRMAGCYVNGDKEKVMTMKEAFLSLPDEEMHKYCDLLRKVLSGTLGRQLHMLEFPMEEETEGGKQDALLKLRDSRLADDGENNSFFDRVIENCAIPGNYLILVAHGTYDIPSRGTDRVEQFDASEYVYRFLTCAICPVSLSKAGLVYDQESNSFVDKLQDHMVDPPEIGFLFPAFNDRNTDIHSVLYHAKNPSDLHEEFTDAVFGSPLPLSAASQKLTFNETVEDVFGRDCDFDLAKTIHENLQVMVEEHKDDPEPAILDQRDVQKFLTQCGADEEKLKKWETSEKEIFQEDVRLMATNLASGKRFEVSSPDVKISISSERTDLIETRIIDGEEYIMIPLSGEVEVNGLRIRRKRNISNGNVQQNQADI